MRRINPFLPDSAFHTGLGVSRSIGAPSNGHAMPEYYLSSL